LEAGINATAAVVQHGLKVVRDWLRLLKKSIQIASALTPELATALNLKSKQDPLDRVFNHKYSV